jgi:hypothetical protein
MVKKACIAVAVGAIALILGLGGRPGQAGWSDAGSGLAVGASSPLISVKKNKKHDDDDDDDHHHGKHHKKNHTDDGVTGQSAPTGGGGQTDTGGVKPIDEPPPATLLLPYFECDVNKPGGCATQNEKK